MKHLGTQYIETNRLILRRFELSDAQAMFDNWASDDEVTKYLTWPTHTDVSVTEVVLKEWVAQYAAEDFYNWAIVLKENGQKPIGSISVVGWEGGGKVPAMGYCIGRRWWHQGVMTQALDAVISFLFRQVGVERIDACHDVNNPHSGGVMRKCGMTYVETKEKAERNNPGVVDTAHYSIKRVDR